MKTETIREQTRVRQKRLRERRSEEGLVSLGGIWVHKDDKDKIIKYVEKINKARGKGKV